MIVRMYTTDNNQLNWYVEMPEEDYLFLRGLERKYGSLSCEYAVRSDTPELLERYNDLIKKYVNGDAVQHVDGPRGLCVYS